MESVPATDAVKVPYSYLGFVYVDPPDPFQQSIKCLTRIMQKSCPKRRFLTVQLLAMAYIQFDIRVYTNYELPSLFPCRPNWACGSCFVTIVFLLGPPY